ncbi:MAG: type IX secretion system protein PorQ [Cytophagaceae bacterium]
MIKKAITLFLFFTSLSATYAQIGGKHSFGFVDMPVNAKAGALGGVNVSVRDYDVNMFKQNPALINDSMQGQLSISYLPYFADINATSLATGFRAGKAGFFTAGLQYFNYGTMTETDATGNVLGSFSAKDYALMIGKSHTVEHFTIGASLKFVNSRIGSYNASAFLMDIGGLFVHPEQDFTIGLAVKNLGVTLNRFSPDSKVNLPFNVQLGTSFKPEHLPVRLSITAHHLHQWDIVYNDPNKRGKMDLDGNEIKEKTSTGDIILRHFIIGGEFILTKNFNIRASYNFLRRKELKLEERSGGAGISLGAMIRVKNFELAYTRAFYHVAGGSNHITVSTNLNRIIKKGI